jgi:hypothetical protein
MLFIVLLTSPESLAAARVSAVAAVSMDVDVPSVLLGFPTFLNP